MIVLVEGADCSGKSTLVERLGKSLSAGYDVEMLHAGKPTSDDILDQYLTPVKRALDPRTALVIDRWHPGELVYGPSRRGKSLLSLGQFEYIELVMQSIGFVGVLSDRASTELTACFERRGDADKSLTKNRLLADAYAFRNLLAARDNWIMYDPGTTRTQEDATHSLTNIISRVTPLAPFVRHPVVGAYVGARWPRVLLVGDRRNPTDQHTALPWPFVPWTGTSGRWMFDALAGNGVSLQKIGVINGSERTPTELQAAWSMLGCPPVVALGVNAHDSLDAAEVPVVVHTHHPQWWRRFKYNEHASFSRDITKAISHA